VVPYVKAGLIDANDIFRLKVAVAELLDNRKSVGVVYAPESFLSRESAPLDAPRSSASRHAGVACGCNMA
jgi:hypothetical protein